MARSGNRVSCFCRLNLSSSAAAIKHTVTDDAPGGVMIIVGKTKNNHSLAQPSARLAGKRIIDKARAGPSCSGHSGPIASNPPESAA